MKFNIDYKNTVFTYILITILSIPFSFLQAQQQHTSTSLETEKKKEKVVKDGDEFIYKQFEVESSVQPLILTSDSSTSNKMNQEYAEETVTKVVMLDNDQDKQYDQIITLNYDRPENNFYDFQFTAKGLEVSLQHRNTTIEKIDRITANKMENKQLIDQKGVYQLTFSNGQKEKIFVKAYQIL
ncbi:hypothetical protein [Aquimarina spongiae]|uniref:Uncharacterized protein n=1 Tax=Aquimarina spongiae TaxID=570521 RepID=A0A1M6B0Y1_9FLAO|nr:hypothetical protein [Aquimarina spongiae]SHI42414.1 hypothetical protein SAMN04488508_101575 [Aquimarina spongiae]